MQIASFVVYGSIDGIVEYLCLESIYLLLLCYYDNEFNWLKVELPMYVSL